MEDKNIRTVRDSLGELTVPADALYSAQTQRAIDNFPISGERLPRPFVEALIEIKRSAAAANALLDCIPGATSKAIIRACDSLMASEDLVDHFPVDVFQTGSGTSSNMNANEVIATLASRHVGREVHPNDHVNFGQSSNDVIPTAIHVSAARYLAGELLPALDHLITTIDAKAETLGGICKTGRTHLMDAMPVRMDQCLDGWSDQLRADVRLLQGIRPAIQTLALGGTAVGTGINTSTDFAEAFAQQVSERTGLSFRPAPNFFPLIGSQDTAVALSGLLKTCAVSLMKIANDLRWMNSGPLAGLGEITLQPLQPGSSIMPGKVNPVIPEAVAMAAAQVIGNDAAITVGGQSGNFELNVMLPMIGANLLRSMTLLSNGSRLLADRAIATFTVNEARLEASLHRNPILVTALNPVIGYAKAAEIAKTAYREDRPILDVASEHTDLDRAQLAELLDPARLTDGGL
ncbi:MAG: class II fumarate hydratase [Pseudomonadota bacterium]